MEVNRDPIESTRDSITLLEIRKYKGPHHYYGNRTGERIIYTRVSVDRLRVDRLREL